MGIFSKRKNISEGMNLEGNAQEILWQGKGRYNDPLVLEHIHEIRNPYHRERVGFEDPIASALTIDYWTRAWAEYPKFYKNDGVGQTEIMPITRQFLQSIHFEQQDIIYETLKNIHGWAGMDLWLDKALLHYFIFSEYQCPPANMWRDETDQIVSYRVARRARLPLNRTTATFRSNALLEFATNDPNVIITHRGSPEATYGFGLSIFEGTWDSITKLREESHANAFRARIFPKAIVPTDWSDTQVQSFFNGVKEMDATNCLISRAGKDSTGKMYPDIPQVSWSSPGVSAQTKSSEGSGGGVFSDLSSEWVRLCAKTNHSIRYFTGNPGGAEAAASVDEQSDLTTDILNFSVVTETLEKFLTWCVNNGVPIDYEPGFRVKSHWEWRRDEALAAQADLMEQQLQIQQQQGQRQNMLPHYLFEEMKRLNTPPGQWVDVNSASGNVKKVKYNPEQAGFAASIDVIYKGGKHYHYQDPNRIKDPNAVSDRIAAEGGEAIWEDLRASKSYRASMAGSPHSALPQTGGSKAYPYVGPEFHQKTYEKLETGGGGGPTPPPPEEEIAPQIAKIGPSKTEKAAAKEAKGKSIGDVFSTAIRGAQAKGQPYLDFDELMAGMGEGMDWKKDIVPVLTEMSERQIIDFVPGATEGKKHIIEKIGGETNLGYTRAAIRPEALTNLAKFGQEETTTKGTPMLTKLLRGYNKLAGFAKHNESPALMSRKRFNEVALDLTGHSFGNETIDYIKKIFLLGINDHRRNSVEIGLPMDFSIDLLYNLNNGLAIEKACKRDWKAVVKNGVHSFIQLYHNDGELKIGTAEFGWDETTDTPTLVVDYSRENVKTLLEEKHLTQTTLYKKICNGEPLPLSTEYDCVIERHNGINYQRKFKNLSVALVDEGNCPSDLCNLSPRKNFDEKGYSLTEVKTTDWNLCAQCEYAEEYTDYKVWCGRKGMYVRPRTTCDLKQS
jgi:hypothetical protein